MLKADPIDWLLEEDLENPGVRYFALRDLLDLPEDDPQVVEAQRAVMRVGPVPVILDVQAPEGYWFKPGAGYSPKYRATAWQVLFLAELGADGSDERVRRGCDYLLDHSPAANGGFSYADPPVPSGVVHCLNGNLLFALIRLGFLQDPRVGAALDWQASAITGEDEIKYFKSATSGPNFSCGINEGQPCGWGAVKAMRGLLAVPPERRSPLINRAIDTSAAFLLSRDPALADYPYTARVSSTWFKFGFPLSYWSDVLQSAEVLVNAGYGGDLRLANLVELILKKQDEFGRWKLENPLKSKFWDDIEMKGKPSKWITLRALRVLKGIGLYNTGL